MNSKKPKKAGPTSLPSKPLSFTGQGGIKNGKGANAKVNSSKKGGVNFMRKLSGM